MQKSLSDRVEGFLQALKRKASEEGAGIDALATSKSNHFVQHTHMLTLKVLPTLTQESEGAAVHDFVEKLRSEGNLVTKAQLFEALFTVCDNAIIASTFHTQSPKMKDDCIAAAIIAVMRSFGRPNSNLWLEGGSRANAPAVTRMDRERMICELLQQLAFSTGHDEDYWRDHENLGSRAIEEAAVIYVRDGRRNASCDHRITRFENVPQPKDRIDAIKQLIENAPEVLAQGRKLNGPGRVFYQAIMEQWMKRQPIARRLKVFATSAYLFARDE